MKKMHTNLWLKNFHTHSLSLSLSLHQVAYAIWCKWPKKGSQQQKQLFLFFLVFCSALCSLSPKKSLSHSLLKYLSLSKKSLSLSKNLSLLKSGTLVQCRPCLHRRSCLDPLPEGVSLFFVSLLVSFYFFFYRLLFFFISLFFYRIRKLCCCWSFHVFSSLTFAWPKK